MRKIISFKKDIAFETGITEITSISLEHTLCLVEDHMISGNFVISGDYKITDSSPNKEKYEYQLPFDIALDARYDINSSVIDIDNFYYEIVDNNILRVNIDVYIEGLEFPEIVVEKKEEIEFDIEEEEELENIIEEEEETYDNIDEEKEMEHLEERCIEEERDINLVDELLDESRPSFLDNMDGNETFVTYHVYIVKENDSLEKIIAKYSITKEDLETYNDIADIKIGDKLIIPTKKNE